MDPEVIEKVTEVMHKGWANPSSKHSPGVKAKGYITEARSAVGQMLNCDPKDIIFTSGGTESANTVLYSSSKLAVNGLKPHFVISNVEHPCVGGLATMLEKEGKIDLTVVPVSLKTGAMVAEDVYAAIRPNTVLVAVMLANNETGIVMPIKEITSLVSKYRNANNSIYPLVLTDAAQAVGKIPVDVKELDVDYLSIAGHKFYGPRCGALYMRDLGDPQGSPLNPLIIGAGHEGGYRSGTENVCMIAGLGKAAELVSKNISQYSKHMKDVRDHLEALLQDMFGDRVHFNGRHEGVPRLPSICSVSIEGEAFHRLAVQEKLKRSQVGTGAACHSRAMKPSAGLLAAGVPVDIANNALRVSLGHNTTCTDVETFAEDLQQAVTSLEHAL